MLGGPLLGRLQPLRAPNRRQLHDFPIGGANIGSEGPQVVDVRLLLQLLEPQLLLPLKLAHELLVRIDIQKFCLVMRIIFGKLLQLFSLRKLRPRGGRLGIKVGHSLVLAAEKSLRKGKNRHFLRGLLLRIRQHLLR